MAYTEDMYAPVGALAHDGDIGIYGMIGDESLDTVRAGGDVFDTARQIAALVRGLPEGSPLKRAETAVWARRGDMGAPVLHAGLLLPVDGREDLRYAIGHIWADTAAMTMVPYWGREGVYGRDDEWIGAQAAAFLERRGYRNAVRVVVAMREFEEYNLNGWEAHLNIRTGNFNTVTRLDES